MNVLVASTIAAHACDGITEMRWLTHAEKWLERGHRFMIAIQYGHGHDEQFDPLIERIRYLNQECDPVVPGERNVDMWGFAADMGEASVDDGNRLVTISLGRNLCTEYAVRHPEFDKLQFIDTDIMPSPDGIEQLLEVNHPMVAAHVPGYCHFAPPIRWTLTAELGFMQQHKWAAWSPECDIPHPITRQPVHFPETFYAYTNEPKFPEGANVQQHWTTAGALMLDKAVYRAVRWGSDPMMGGQSDDPHYQFHAEQMGFGMTWVRHDVVWDHEALVPLLHRGRDLSVRR